MVGVKAAAQNLPMEFKTPANNDTKETNNKNGKVILDKVVVSCSLPGTSSKPGANKNIKAGIKISITMTKSNNT